MNDLYFFCTLPPSVFVKSSRLRLLLGSIMGIPKGSMEIKTSNWIDQATQRLLMVDCEGTEGQRKQLEGVHRKRLEETSQNPTTYIPPIS
jgi:hypothetical protein